MTAANFPEPKPLRVCVVTSFAAAIEPRAPRHAVALAQLGAHVEVTFMDCQPEGEVAVPVAALTGQGNLTHRTRTFPTRASGAWRLAAQRLQVLVGRAWFAVIGRVVEAAFSTRVIGLEAELTALRADIYFAHNADTLLPAYRAAQSVGAKLMFDSMEFHSDMGDAQTAIERRLTVAVEKLCLPACALVTASSPQVADALVEKYGIARPLPLENTPPVEPELPPKPASGLQLYWRNSVLGLGQRGLDDALLALQQLPADVTLHLQGRFQFDGGTALRARIAELGLTERVIFSPPYLPEAAVAMAARHHIGLCLERRGCRNHDLTTSNKIFDYHMAGLAVVASDLPGLRGVMERSGGGLIFQSGSVADLTNKILQLYHDSTERARLAGRARAFALREGNRGCDVARFVTSVCEVMQAKGQVGECRHAPMASLDVPILMYHHLVPQLPANEAWYEITQQQFEQQLDALQRWGYTTVSLQQLFRVLRGEESALERMVVITFDDAFRSFLELGLPALQARGMTATMFLPVGELGGTNRWDVDEGIPPRDIMNVAEIKQLMASGIEIGAHGWAHRNLARCSADEAHEEIFRTREEMRRLFGVAPDFYAYPYGAHKSEVFPLLAEAGYTGAVSIFSRAQTVTANRFTMRRIYVHSGDNLFRFRVKLSPFYARMMVLRAAL